MYSLRCRCGRRHKNPRDTCTHTIDQTTYNEMLYQLNHFGLPNAWLNWILHREGVEVVEIETLNSTFEVTKVSEKVVAGSNIEDDE